MVWASVACSTCQGGDPRRGGECGKESLGIVACREVKRPVGQIGGDPPRTDQKPHQTRFGTTTKIEGFVEKHGPRLRGVPRWTTPESPMALSLPLPGEINKDHAMQHVQPPPAARTIQEGTLRPGLGTCPSLLRLINC
jgi:hypothetical protein